MKEILKLLREYNKRKNQNRGIIKFYDDGSGSYYADDDAASGNKYQFSFVDEKELISQLKEKKIMTISEIEKRLGMDEGTLDVVKD